VYLEDRRPEENLTLIWDSKGTPAGWRLIKATDFTGSFYADNQLKLQMEQVLGNPKTPISRKISASNFQVQVSNPQKITDLRSQGFMAPQPTIVLPVF